MIFEAKSSPWRLRLLTLLSCGFVAMGVWMVGGFGIDRPVDLKATLIGWSSIAFFGPCAFVIARRSLAVGIVVRADADGIWMKDVPGSPIPWREIVATHEFKTSGQKMLGLELRDPSRYRMAGLQGRLAGANRALTGVDALWLTMTGTDRTYDELATAIAALRNRELT